MNNAGSGGRACERVRRHGRLNTMPNVRPLAVPRAKLTKSRIHPRPGNRRMASPHVIGSPVRAALLPSALRGDNTRAAQA